MGTDEGGGTSMASNDMIQCPCCKGSGFVEKGADVHDVRPHGFRRFK